MQNRNYTVCNSYMTFFLYFGIMNIPITISASGITHGDKALYNNVIIGCGRFSLIEQGQSLQQGLLSELGLL